MNNSNSKEDDYYSSLPKQKFRGDEYQYQWNGFWFTLPMLQSNQQVLTNFKPLPSDVILASFPKTGTTWLKALLFCIINRSSRNLVLTKNPHMLVPTLEIHLYGQSAQPWDTYASISSCPARIFASHLSYQVLQNTINSSDCRVVYIARNPKDTIVSFWHFLQKAIKYNDSFSLEDAVDSLCKGSLIYGPYYDHVLGYWKESLERPRKVFFITYEELKKDTKTHVKKLAEFLGCPFEGDGDELAVMDEIVKNCSFEEISSYEANKSNERTQQMFMPPSSLFRRGEVGDHKNYLSEEMIDRIDKLTKDKFHGAGFMYGI